MSTDSELQKVRLDIDGHVATLQLSRPEVLNAIDQDLIDQLDSHLDTIGASAVRVVIVTGAGRAFCAGADLKAIVSENGSVDPGAAAEFVHNVSHVVKRLADLPMPVIAAVNGAAYAGGLELLLACDLVVAAEGADISDAHASHGLLPGAGGAVRLPRIVGETVAKYMIFTGCAMKAESLVAHGLVNEVVPAQELLDRVAELARHLSRLSPLGLTTMKRLIDDGLAQPIDSALRLEAHAHDAHSHTADFREGVTSFGERRRPVFGGTAATTPELAELERN